MKKYLVGGAVRDKLLGIADNNTEKDWLIVGSSTAEMLNLGYQKVGKDFPVFLHPESKEEYALARIERKVGKGYNGFEFDSDKSVTLEQDLSRRDISINAIAERDGELFDPFNGRADIENGLLKHISPAFSEDPVRVLRVARFAAQFKKFGFKVAHSTHKLMQNMVTSGEVDALTAERIFKELSRALSVNTPSAFFKVLTACGAYEKVFFPLKSYENERHQNSFEKLDNMPTDSAKIRFAIWLKDENFELIGQLCQRLKCPKKYQELAQLTNQYYQFAQKFSQQNDAEILQFFAKTDAIRRKNRFAELLQTFEVLGVDVQNISKLTSTLAAIDVAKLDKTDIAAAIKIEKIRLIKLFIDST
ncbi:MAG: polynucleotide adenylyltransferase [Candidatus Thioglobus sp.]|nr:MAG: polynucleotide adenylyltransferase [Candidatus Thioglobus sp.]